MQVPPMCGQLQTCSLCLGHTEGQKQTEILLVGRAPDASGCSLMLEGQTHNSVPVIGPWSMAEWSGACKSRDWKIGVKEI